MSYKPEPLNDLARELGKIASTLDVHAGAIAGMSARVQALEARPVIVPPAVPSADVLWQWDATSIAPFFLHAKDPSRAIFTQAGGRNAVRLLTMPGDNNVNGSNLAERCDLRLGNAESDANEGREWWFAHSVWFPDDYVDQPQSNGMWHWGAVFDWHDDSDTAGSQGPLQLMSMPRTAISADRPTGLHFQVYAGPGGVRLGDFPVSPIERNKWFDFVYHIRWTATSTGFADGWVNGTQFMAHKGPTLHAGHGAYLKLANYHTAHGKPSAVIHGRVVRARTEAALA